MMSDLSRRWLLMTSAALNLYLLGAACVLWAAQYPQLGEVARNELPAFHAALTRRLPVAFILPEFLSFFSLLPMLWRRVEGVPGWAAWACVALGVAYFGITFGWHLPAHRLLGAGDGSPEVMGALMTSHAVRTVTVALRCGVLAWMISAAMARR
jgi:hypothetical protein